MDEVKNFIKKNRLMVLATISAENDAPQMALVYYVVDPHFHIYLATSKHSGKVRNIEDNGLVSLLIGHEVEPQTIQILGKATVVKDLQRISDYTAQILIRANANQESVNFPPLLMLTSGQDLVLIRVEIEKFKFSDFSRGKAEITEGTESDLAHKKR